MKTLNDLHAAWEKRAKKGIDKRSRDRTRKNLFKTYAKLRALQQKLEEAAGLVSDVEREVVAMFHGSIFRGLDGELYCANCHGTLRRYRSAAPKKIFVATGDQIKVLERLHAAWGAEAKVFEQVEKARADFYAASREHVLAFGKIRILIDGQSFAPSMSKAGNVFYLPVQEKKAS